MKQTQNSPLMQHLRYKEASKMLSPVKTHTGSIDIYLTTRCNLHCVTCYLGDKYFHSTIDIPLNRVNAILSWARRNNIMDVAFLGGEPTLHPKFLEIAHLATEHGFTSRRIVTNANSKFRRLIPNLKKFLTRVNVSVDGHNSHTHDFIRGTGSFADVELSLEALRQNRLPFGITHTPTKKTVSCISKLITHAERSGAKEINIHWPSPVGRLRSNIYQYAVKPKEWIKLLTDVSSYRFETKDFFIHVQQAYIHKSFMPNLDSKTVCAVKSCSNFQFLPDGNVISCGMLADSPHLSGYEFNGNEVIMREGKTEVTMTRYAEGPNCPIRNDITADDRLNFSPVCIYLRKVISHDQEWYRSE